VHVISIGFDLVILRPPIALNRELIITVSFVYIPGSR